MRTMIKGLSCFLLSMLMFFEGAHFAFADQVLSNEAFFAHPESVSRMVNIPGLSTPLRYYAQNDALWGDLVFEQKNSKMMRPFRDSGCGPTSLAIAIANLVPEEKLCLISQYAKVPYSLCTCSINDAWCARHRERYYITSQRDYVRFLPLIFGDFATGNNTFGVYSRSETIVGTSTAYIDKVCSVYGISTHITNSYDDAIAAITDPDQAVIALAAKNGCFTNTGHYVYLAHIDDEYLYVLDSLNRSEYKTNYGHKINIIEPGVVSLRHNDVKRALFYRYIILSVQHN